MGDEFVRGQVCEGSSLSGSEMSRNHLYHIIGSLFLKESFFQIIYSPKTCRYFYIVKLISIATKPSAIAQLVESKTGDMKVASLRLTVGRFSLIGPS